MLSARRRHRPCQRSLHQPRSCLHHQGRVSRGRRYPGHLQNRMSQLQKSCATIHLQGLRRKTHFLNGCQQNFLRHPSRRCQGHLRVLHLHLLQEHSRRSRRRSGRLDRRPMNCSRCLRQSPMVRNINLWRHCRLCSMNRSTNYCPSLLVPIHQTRRSRNRHDGLYESYRFPKNHHSRIHR